MKIILYILYITPSLLALATAGLFNRVFARFVDKDGNLPWYLRWFQPSDNPATGDRSWKDEHPGMSNYELAVSYMNRNPAQGFDQLLAAKVTMQTQCRVRGNIDIGDKEGIAGWYLITTEEGYFHFAYVMPWAKAMLSLLVIGFLLALKYHFVFLVAAVFASIYLYRTGKCVTGGFGWRLNNIVKKYEHKTMGQFIFTPFRFQDFGRK